MNIHDGLTIGQYIIIYIGQYIYNNYNVPEKMMLMMKVKVRGAASPFISLVIRREQPDVTKLSNISTVNVSFIRATIP